MPERLYAIEAKITFLANTVDPHLLYDREINTTIRNPVLYLHLSPTEMVLYCSRIRNKAKANDNDIIFQYTDCICGTTNVLPVDTQPDRLEFEDHCCALFFWLKSRTTYTNNGYKIFFDNFTEV